MNSNIAGPVTAERVKRVAQGFQGPKGDATPGLGGGFQFCRLSAEPLFDAEGQIRHDVTFAQLAEFVWFAEAGSGYAGQADSPLLGVHEGRAIYLLYNGILKDRSVAGGNVLTGPVFDVLRKFSGPKVIYAAPTAWAGVPPASASASSRRPMHWRSDMTHEPFRPHPTDPDLLGVLTALARTANHTTNQRLKPGVL